MQEFIVILLIVVALAAGFAYRSLGTKATPERPKRDDKKTEAKEETGGDKIPLTIFYGSQSGTAETFAGELADQAKAHGFKGTVVDLEGYDPSELANVNFAVFLMATFGEGEPTDNAQEFYSSLPGTDRHFENLHFAVFALGNRQYEKYCEVGRQVDKQLRKLGAKPILDLGEGDDDGSLEDDFGEWKTRFWQTARQHFGISGQADGDEDEAFKATIGVHFYQMPKSEDGKPLDGVNMNIDPKAPPIPEKFVGGITGFQKNTDPKHKAELALVTVNKELRNDTTDGGSTRHIELDITSTRLKYLTADNLGVYPRNDYKDAAKLAMRLGVDTRAVFRLEKKAGNRKLPLQTPCNVHDALMWYCDFNSVVRTKTLKMLAQYASNPDEKQKLIYLATDHKAKEEFHAEQKSLLEVLEEFPSVKPPFADFLEWMPKLQPRFYTISSSSRLHPKTIHLTVTLTRVEKKDGRVHMGVCSNYLANLKPGRDTVCVFVRASSFRLPKKPDVPVIMVGPGTGVAPFRAFVQEANALANYKPNPELKVPAPPKLGKMSLYFGCRNRELDFIYQEELEGATKAGHLHELVVAYSREQKEKVYVQHKLHDKGSDLWTVIDKQRAAFYVCGSAAMGRSVREMLTKLAETHGQMNNDKAHDYVKRMQNEQRFIQELWS